MFDGMRRLLLGSTKRVSKPTTGEQVSDKMLHGYSRGNGNPDETLVDRGTTLAIYDRMMLDDKIAGIMRLKKSIALSCDWEIKGDDEATNDWAKEILENLDGLSFADVLDNMLDAWIYGFKLAEIVWEYDEGLLIPKRIKPKYSQRIEFKTDDFGNLEYAYIGGVETNRLDVKKPGKFLLLVHPYARDGNWYGQSDLGSIYREWRAKDALVKWRTIALMKFGSAAIVGVAEQKQMAALAPSWQTLKDWQEFGLIKMPGKRDPKTGEMRPLIDVSLLESKNASADNYTNAIRELDKAIARKLLVPDKLGFSDTAGGSFNNDEMQFNIVLSDIRREHARLNDMVNFQLLTPLCEINGKQPCRLHFVGLTEGLTPTKVNNIATLLGGGAINKREEWIRPYLGVPEMDPELQAELDEMAAAIVPPGAPPPKGDKKPPETDGNVPKEREEKVAQIRLQIQRKTPEINYLDRINYMKVSDDLNSQEGPAVDAIVTALDTGAAEMTAWLQERGILDGRNIQFVENLNVPRKTKKSFQWISETLLGRAAFHGKQSAAQELKAAKRVTQTLGKDLGWAEIDSSDYLDKEWLRAWLKEHSMTLTDADRKLTELAIQNAFTIAGVMEEDLLNTVKQTVFSNYGKVMGKVLAGRIREQVKDLGRAHAVNIVRTNSSKYYNNGRYAEFAEAGDLVVGAQGSAILDDNTTPYCEAHHGHFLLQSNPLYGLGPPWHYQCRMLMVAVFAGDEYTDDWNDVPANAMNPQQGFGA